MTISSGFAKVLVITAASSVVINGQATGNEPTLPTVVSAEILVYPRLPVMARVQGTFRYAVTTDGERVASAEPLQANALFDAAVLANLRSWRFAAHRPIRFESSFTFISGASTCVGEVAVPDEPDFVRMDFPAVFETRESYGRNCYSGGHPPMTVGSGDVFERVFGVAVTVNPHPGFGCCLPVKPARVPAKPMRSELVVSRASVSGYPVSARLAGVEGIVRVLASSTGEAVVAEGPPELAAATLAAVKGWAINTPTEPAEITFTYKLVPGDCSGGGPIVVTTPLIRHISITAKRVVSCGTDRLANQGSSWKQPSEVSVKSGR